MTLVDRINAVGNALGHGWFDLLAGWPVWLQMIVTAIPVTLFALLVFRFASDQSGIAYAKDQIKAHLLELWLYRDYPRVMLKAQAQVFLNSFTYLGYSLLPLLIMIVPLGLLLVQIEIRFAHRPIAVGESLIVTVNQAAALDNAETTLVLSPGLEQQTPGLRLAGDAQTLFRIGGTATGPQQFSLRVGAAPGAGATIGVTTGFPGAPIARAVYPRGDWRALFDPAAPPLDPRSGIDSVEIDYPAAGAIFAGISGASWFLLLATLILGFAFRSRLGVTF